MRCLDAGQIARAATTGGDDPHFSECLACRRILEADRSTRDALRALAIPRMSPQHRRALAAEVLAAADHTPMRRAPRTGWLAAASALAAAVALVAWWPKATTSEPAPHANLDSVESVSTSTSSIARLEAPPALPPATIDARGAAKLSHTIGTDRDLVTLVDGLVEIDTRSARNVDVRVGDSIVRVDDARITIRARHRAIVSVQVVVGSARITGPDQRVTLQRDSLWLPGPSTTQQSLTAFRDGWVALRAGNNREAIELFDRVTDPIVVEEATYWAAIAARRSGDAELARDHIATFLRRFPQSEYAAELRALTP